MQYDLTASGASVTIGGVTFQDSDNINSGTGNYGTFLKIQNNPSEAGFNANPPADPSNPDIDNAFTHTIQLGGMPIKVVGGVEYYEIRIDVNEPNNSTNRISLDQFKIYTSSNGNITTTAALFASNLRYDMDAGGDNSLMLIDASSGSGTDDYAIFVPVSLFPGLSGSTYVYVYAQLGALGGDYVANAGFEEFEIQAAGSVSGIKFFDDNKDGVRQAAGRDGVLGTADDEKGIGGVTIFIDLNGNGVYDPLSDRSTVTAADGSYHFDGVLVGTQKIYEVVPAGYTRTTGDFETVTVVGGAVSGTVGPNAIVDDIGNWKERPDFTVTKDVASITGDSDANGAIDTAGGIITYLITATNTGNISLADFVLTDANATLGARTGDANANGVFDVGETWSWSATHVVTQAELDAKGTAGTGAVDGDGDVDNIATGSAHGLVRSDDAVTLLDYRPGYSVTKGVTSITGDTNGNGAIDKAGGVITYDIVVKNTGNITLGVPVVTDANATVSAGPTSGDGNLNGILDVGETWHYTATHTVTQAELDAKGTGANGAYDGDGDVDNTVGVVALGISHSADAPPVLLDYSAKIDIEKYVSNDPLAITNDADSVTGPSYSSGPIYFKITLANTGNITLTSITLSDVITNYTNNTTSPIDLSGYTLVESGTADGKLDVNETATLIYSRPFEIGQHTNTASVTAKTALNVTATDSDAANYWGVSALGPGVRTPGFWTNLGKTFWDGQAGLPKQAGQPGFYDKEIPLDVVNGNKGLLIGFGGDTIFIKLTDAQQLIDASAKTAKSDGLQILGRDVVATWLNYLVGNPITAPGDTDANNSPKHLLQDAVDWLQKYGDANSDGIFDFGGNNPIKTSSSQWQTGIVTDHSAASIHSQLDYYNNTGMTVSGGTVYAGSADNAAYLAALQLVATP